MKDETAAAIAVGFPVPVADQIALADAAQRKWVAIAIVIAFRLVNGVVLCGVWLAYKEDIALLTRTSSTYQPSNRLVTTTLMMTLVGATTVQLGAFIVLTGKYLFPAPRA